MIFGPKRFIHAYGHPAVASQQQVANGNAPALTGHEILAPSFAVGLSSRRATLFEQLDRKPSTKVISRLIAPKFDFCSNPESGLRLGHPAMSVSCQQQKCRSVCWQPVSSRQARNFEFELDLSAFVATALQRNLIRLPPR